MSFAGFDLNEDLILIAHFFYHQIVTVIDLPSGPIT